MDAFIGLFVFTTIVVVFVLMVRRTNERGRRALHQAAHQPASHKPAPLSKAQRKDLDLPDPSEQSRAIRTGWQLCEVEFAYEDAQGATSYRTVTVHWVGDSTFKGECHERQAERTFRLDRVIGDITDTETGEMLEPEEWASDYR